MQPNIGHRLKMLRDMKHYPQMKLEVEAELSIGTISRIENQVNVPTLDTLLKISHTMQLTSQETIFLILGWQVANSIERRYTLNDKNITKGPA